MISFDNIKKIAQWDLTINRAAYRKLFLTIILGNFIIFFFHIVPQVYTVMNYGEESIIPEIEMYGDYNTANFLLVINLLAYILAMGMMFSSLATRQGRLNEFLLPASNAERFTWRVFSTTIGTAACIVVSLIAYDLLQMLVHELAFTSYPTKSIFVMTGLIGGESRPIPEGEGLEWFFANLFSLLNFIALASSYILGSAIKYRKSIAWTTLVHTCIVMLLIFIFIFMINTGLADALADFMQGLFGNHENDWIFFCILCVLLSCLCLFFWRKTYKLYCRGQLTSRLNP